MKYKILNADNSVVLQTAVMSFLSEGWELQGGVSVAMTEYDHMNAAEGYTETSGSIVFAQALIKRPSQAPTLRFSEDGKVERLNQSTLQWEVVDIPPFA